MFTNLFSSRGKYEISETGTPSRLWSGTSDSNMLNNNRYAVANRHVSIGSCLIFSVHIH